MKAFVGVTDYSWFRFLQSQSPDEVNFWQPSGRTQFRALSAGELFLFKLHAPRNYIVGGGFFVRSSLLPTFLAWEAFGIKNGVSSVTEFDQKIHRYKKNREQLNPIIGCIILSDPFFFDESEWIPVPEDWSPNIVVGKTYSGDTRVGRGLIDEVYNRLQQPEAVGEVQFSQRWTTQREGQGAFRVGVTDAYHRRCAISGEKTLPILDAAHIKPVSVSGTHSISNGLLLRTDIHGLYDRGYMTITPDYHIEVSKRLDEEYGNGKIYYNYHGLLVPNLPNKRSELPNAEALQWHNAHVYR